jgi:predicted nucleic acid-binding protein
VGVLIDSSILIEHERGRLSLEECIKGRETEEFFLSVVSASELMHGVHRAPNPAVRARRSAWVEGVLERFAVLPIDLAVARAHAPIWAALGAAGRLIGPHDLWLAATCVAHGLTLVTANEREFRRVPGLSLENWASSG